ncbi:PEP-CTERM sorting domain-containing protein [Rubritalea tangerina]|uniref:PEP-CTERM sorting domain-containing protein n=1 Tax=Rubritalea tangerina TaxID=430798 RepID=A0ABW4ZCA3_9BACT
MKLKKTSLMLLATFAGMSYAQAVTLINASFESPQTFNSFNYDRINDPTGWTIDRPASAWDVAAVNQAYADAADVQVGPLIGNQALWVSNNGGQATNMSAESFASHGAGTFTFTLAIGQSQNFAGVDLITISIVDGNGSVLNSNAITTLDPGDDLADFSVDYSATGAEFGNVGVRVTSGADNLTGVYVVDNARLDFSAVPEPSSTMLLGLGGLALIMRRRK